MKALLYLTVIVVFASSTNAQKRPHREIHGLKGMVKSVVEKEADYEEKFGKYVKGAEIESDRREYSREGYLTRFPYASDPKQGYFVETVDKLGNVLTSKVYTAKGKVVVSEKSVVDANGRITETSTDYGTKRIPKYNEQGRMMEEASYSTDGQLLSKTIYDYDAEGHTTKITNYDKDGIVKSSEVKQYDARGFLSRDEEEHDGVQTITAYENDSLGNPVSIEDFVTKYDDKPSEKKTYEYNDHGDPVKVTVYGYGGTEVERIITISYVYDGHGNWVEKQRMKTSTEFGKTEEHPFAFNRRIITYY